MSDYTAQITFTARELLAMRRECSQNELTAAETTSTVGDWEQCKNVLRRVMQAAGVERQGELI